MERFIVARLYIPETMTLSANPMPVNFVYYDQANWPPHASTISVQSEVDGNDIVIVSPMFAENGAESFMLALADTALPHVALNAYLYDAETAMDALDAVQFDFPAEPNQARMTGETFRYDDLVLFQQTQEPETMSTQTVIDTAAVSNALTNDLTLDSMAAVVTALATAANNADIANKTELLNMINAMQPQIDAALEAADKLENYELGQVEAILQQLVSSDGFQTLLQTATVTVDGSAMTLESVLTSLLDAPRVASWDFQRDAGGNITGVLANLTDGSTANMAVTKTTMDEGLATEFDRYTFAQADWAGKGFAASFDVDLIARDIDFGGLFGLGSMGFGVDIKKQGNLLFDITGAAAGDAPTVEVPDANNDGVIGNPEPVANT